MHPAFSVIFFTTASGAGYGLLALLGVFAPLGLLPAERWLGLAGMALALTLITFGLLASTFHLGHPERAWRSFAEWRSSWLSREAVASVATYLPAGLFAIGWVFWQDTSGVWAAFGGLSAVGAAATVYCTAMIYASLTPIRQWRNRWVAPIYLAFALMGGALWLNGLALLFGAGRDGFVYLALIAILVAAVLKIVYWHEIDTGASASTPESATGLGDLGQVRQLDPPHSQENFVMREMGYRIARRHVPKLRLQVYNAAFGLPFLLSVGVLFSDGWPALAAGVAAPLIAAAGTLVERWLFFAEAKHAVTLYYGARSV